MTLLLQLVKAQELWLCSKSTLVGVFPPPPSAVKPISRHQTIIFLTSLVLCTLLCTSIGVVSAEPASSLKYAGVQNTEEERGVEIIVCPTLRKLWEENKSNPSCSPTIFCLSILLSSNWSAGKQRELLGAFNQTHLVSQTAILHRVRLKV